MTTEVVYAAANSRILNKKKRQALAQAQFSVRSKNRRTQKTPYRITDSEPINEDVDDTFRGNLEKAFDQPPTKKRRVSGTDHQANQPAKVGKSLAELDDLPWKPLARPHQGSSGGELTAEGAMLMLEEVEGVDVEFEDVAGGGKVLKFLVNSQTPSSSQRTATEIPPLKPARAKVSKSAMFVLDDDFEDEKLLPNWASVQIAKPLKKALHASNFLSPFEIQSRALPVALEGRDVIGVAETGSGKTLAYGLPILHHILSNPRAEGLNKSGTAKRPLSALVLAPTRELAIQVADHLNVLISKLTPKDNAGSSTKGPPLISAAAVVGGMSAQKQRRIIDRGVDIIIATPGRLWDLLGEDDGLANAIRSIRFLVLDEADRMIETGHFQELDQIVKLTLRVSEEDKEESDPAFEGMDVAKDDHPQPNDNMQTFIFSATLSKDLQRNLKKRQKGSWGKQKVKASSTLDDLLMKLDFRDENPEVIDLSPEGGAVSTLQESKVECITGDKDLYLYYFLLRYPGRSLIFLGSIDGIRRLTPLLELLQLKVFPLHAQLQQKQRLKNLERFKSSSDGVLIATDVAARGLDIPSVDHVIHYQIPRSADTYIHRNGRTARAKRSGFSLQLVAPDERKMQRALLQNLQRDDNVPDLIVDHDILDKLRQRITLARQIDSTQHKVKKESHEKSWMRETAEAMELEIDSDVLSESDQDDRKANKSVRRKSQKSRVNGMKAELASLLKEPLVARGISAKYITSGSRPIVDELIDSTNHTTLLGLKKMAAGMESVRGKVKSTT